MPKFLPSMSVGRQHLMEQSNPPYQFKVPESFAMDDLLTPSSWRNVSNLKLYDQVRIIRADGKLIVDLLVMDVQTGYAKMIVVNKIHDDTASVKAENPESKTKEKLAASKRTEDEYPCVDFKKTTGWRVLGYNGEEVKKGLSTQEDAQRILDDYISRSKAAA